MSDFFGREIVGPNKAEYIAWVSQETVNRIETLCSDESGSPCGIREAEITDPVITIESGKVNITGSICFHCENDPCHTTSAQRIADAIHASALMGRQFLLDSKN